MKLFAIKYTNEVCVRVPTHGGMDSEFSHREVQTHTKRIIAPCEGFARAYLDNTAGHSRDQHYKILSVEESTVDAIVAINHGLGFTVR